jgi:uncharacterized protein with HEPN domain
MGPGSADRWSGVPDAISCPIIVNRVWRSDVYLLDHMWHGIERIDRHTEGSATAIVRSPLVRDAVEFVLGSVAGASAGLSPGIRARHPEVDWTGLEAIRRGLVEEYGEVDATGVVEFLARQLPSLRAAVHGELENWTWSDEAFEPCRSTLTMGALRGRRQEILQETRSAGMTGVRALPPELGENPPGTDLLLIVVPPDPRLLGGFARAEALEGLQAALSALLGCVVEVAVEGQWDGSWPLFERRVREAAVPL